MTGTDAIPLELLTFNTDFHQAFEIGEQLYDVGIGGN
jgi:hypothetical protein